MDILKTAPLVLLVEDSDLFAGVIRDKLHSVGYHVHHEPTHDLALQWLKQGEAAPAIIFNDFDTGGQLNGLSFMHALKTLPHAEPISVVGISGDWTCNRDMEQAGAKGSIDKGDVLRLSPAALYQALQGFGVPVPASPPTLEAGRSR